PDQVGGFRGRSGLIELLGVQPPAPQLLEADAGTEVSALREGDPGAGRKEREYQRSCRPGARREQEGVPAVELAETPLGLDARRMGVPLVVEGARLTFAVRPDRGAVEHSA